MTFQNWTEEKAFIWLGHFFFFCFLLGGIFFYKERLLAFDTAYYTFHVVVNEEFFIKHNRYISYFSQWVPILAMKAGLSLQAVLILFSSSFMAIYYAIFTLVTHGFKHPRAGLFIALSYGLCTRYKYYAAISEISISIALAGLLIAWLTRPKVIENRHQPLLHWLVAALMLIPLFISHPIIIIPLLFFLGFDIIYNGKWGDWQNWLFIVSLMVVYYFKFKLVQTDAYEADRASSLTFEHAVEVFSNTKEHAVFDIIGWYFRTEFVVPFLAFVIALVALVREKRAELMWYAILGTIGWLLINVLTYSYLRGFVLIMIDGYLAILGMFWATAMYFTFLKPSEQWSWWKIGGLTFLVLFSLQRIYAYHDFYENRLEMMEATLDKYPNERKLIVDIKEFDWDEIWYPYEVPHESLMLSALKNDGEASTIYVNDFGRKASDLQKKDVFYHFDTYLPIEKLPEQYFKLPDSTSYLQIKDPAWLGNEVGSK